ncbi:2-hydroxy-3-oxopropionate reductase ['Osedax' symbiont bacterium Rs2_46_30_T18]|nr:2-hydroxy-3-oxopropionate reductase ['Osedax' symbiont bacterium Rs2_46_30_T18]
MIIAFLGTGLMGLPMAGNLLKAGFSVNVYNRSVDKTTALARLGATVSPTPTEAIRNAQVIITMLDSAATQEQVLLNTAALSQCLPGSLIIDMASIAPDTAKQHAQLANSYQLDYVDAPVSGGTKGAQEGTLVIMAGASESDLLRAQPIFTALASNIIHIGPVGTGQIAKCANQAIVAVTIGAVSEALLLAAKGGADITAVREALLGGFASSKVLDQHGQRMIQRNFTPGAAAKVQLKDLNNISTFARAHNLQLPLTESVQSQYQQLVDSGREDLDHSALLLLLESLNNTTLID